jgi:CRP-like cAMP-binding protein
MTTGFAHSRLIARLRAIAALTDADASLIASLPIALRNVGAGYDIARDGTVIDQSCLLVDGYLFRHKSEMQGKRQIVSWHVPGDIPDLYSLHLLPLDHNITSLGPAVVGFIPHKSLHEVLNRSPSLTGILWRETLVDASIFRELVVNLGKRDAMARIAHMLCELLVRLRVVGLAKDGTFTFPASQLDVADATGITPVHANRMIQQLRSQGLVEWEGSEIAVPNFDELKRIAEFDDRYLHHRRS